MHPPFGLSAKIAALSDTRAKIAASLSDLDNRPCLLDALDGIAEHTGKIRALKMIERVPTEQRRAEAVRLLCDLSQKPTPADNEGIAVNAERDTYAALIERGLV